ncbi:MAG: NLP/P60 protein [Berkelbacteria bacterium GW2011_GWA1_36_9]|uniref:NLP/P60 protein n=1 Tax=Berkelbacteria bacterium GW2011_GWA1_36_9 TaxID=1618331 RepID=A0A0G0FI03_9BACT|nr:MAG: NLP/P60 protein [Berkelbacteria bacterium GW2011_GWA1_36_9]
MIFLRSTTLTIKDRVRIIEEAYKFLGTPYCLKGDGKNYQNCSQFVVTVIKNALNIDLPAKVDWLYIVSLIIKPENLQMGDLVFFCRQPRPIGKIATHVAIFVGDNQVIHARQRAGKVVIEPIADFSETIITSKDSAELHQWLEETISLTRS